MSDELLSHSAMLHDLPVAVWVARAPDGEFVYANREFDLIMGTPPRHDPDLDEAASGYGIRHRNGDLYAVEDLPFFRAVRAREMVVIDDLVIHRRDRTKVAVRAFARPIVDANGEVTQVIISFIDISGEVAAVDARTVAQERLAAAVNHAPIILFAFDESAVVTVSEGAGLAAIGYRSGELVGRSALEMYGDNSEVTRNIRRALAGETFTNVNEVGAAALETWMSPIVGDGGKVVGAIGVSTDVTNRRRLEAKAVLADRVMSMGRLSASVAHEINNPLTYMMISLARIEEESRRVLTALEANVVDASGIATAQAGVRRLRELLDLAREGAERVRVVTQDLRSFSRPDDDRKTPVDIRRVAQTLLSLVSNETETRARLVVDLAPVAFVAANEARLLQVFLNLLRNATQAVAAVEGRPEIRVSTRTEGANVIFQVEDSGPGIADSIRDRLFEPFTTTKPVGEGTGLGLFVSRNIARDLGGDVVAETRASGGAVFRVVLPAAKVGDANLTTTSATIGAVERPSPGRRGRVLVVDDDARVGRMLRESLSAHHEVRLATGGREALEILAADPGFDLIFCDVMMREVAGMDVYAELEKSAPQCLPKLVFMSGGAFTDRARAFLAAVSNDRLDKPFDIVAEVERRLR